MPTKPFDYQSEDAFRIEELNGIALCSHEMGLGKSLISLLYAHRNPELRPLLIICPASLKWNWERECSHHFNMRAEILNGTKIHEEKIKTNHPVIIVNYDILQAWLPWIVAQQPKMIIADEAHYFCTKSTKRSKLTKVLARTVKKIIALTGTPIISKPAEIWNILNTLRPDLYPSFWNFAHTYCNPRMTPWGWNFDGAKDLDKLHKELTDRIMVRRLKKDVMHQLPPKHRIVVPMEIDNRKEYDRAVKDFIGWLRRVDPSKAKRAARAQKLAQMSYLKQMAGRGKLRAVFEWIDNFFAETGEKLVLFAVHRALIAELKEHYKDACVTVDGSVTGRDRMMAVDAFQKKKSVRLFIGNIKAAGVGLNLTASNTVAFCEMGWTPGEHAQAEDRCHRIGTVGSVNIYYLVAKETIESRLCEVIQKKAKVLAAVMDGKKNGKEMNVFDLLEKELLREQL